MLPRTLECPQCGKAFATQRSPGMQVHCPVCLTYFAVPFAPAAAAEATPVFAAPAPEPVKSSSPHSELLNQAEEPAMAIPAEPPRPKPAKRKPIRSAPASADASIYAEAEEESSGSGESQTGTLAVVAMLAALLCGGGYGLHWFLTHRPQPDAAEELVASAGDKKNAPQLPIDANPPPAAQAKGVADAPKPAPTDPTPASDVKPPMPKEEGPKVRPIVKDDGNTFFKPVAVNAPGNTDMRTWAVPGIDSQRIAQAIDDGVRFLKGAQKPSGSWSNGGHSVGYAALPGLVLLECKVPPADASVQAAARHVRMNSDKLNQTYDLSLAILFLDRLGDTRDRPLIQAMALRLVAGQTDAGGWTYTCPVLSREDAVPLLTFLQRTKPNVPVGDPLKANLPNFDPLGPGNVALIDPLGRPNPNMPNPLANDPKSDIPIPLQGFGPDRFPIPLQGKDELKGKDDLRAILPVDSPEDQRAMLIPVEPMKEKLEEPAPAAVAKPVLRPKALPIRPDALPPGLRKLPVVTQQVGMRKDQWAKKQSHDDNSNTQFAMLALWAARRHGVPTEQALMISDQRFTTSQNVDGGWGYHLRGGSSATMTCVGLLGLAMGHGAKGPAAKAAGGLSAEDPAIQAGLRKLGSHLGEPVEAPQAGLRMENLYLLWSVERVAMLYHLKTIGAKDWYGWGAQILVVNQRADGGWDNGGGYHGADPTVNTSFALLFLKRSNLVQDLTENLRLQMAITDPDHPGR